MANCDFCKQMRAHFLKRLKGGRIRIKFTPRSGQGVDRVEYLIARKGKWLLTKQGQHHVKDIQQLGRER